MRDWDWSCRGAGLEVRGLEEVDAESLRRRAVESWHELRETVR